MAKRNALEVEEIMARVRFMIAGSGPLSVEGFQSALV